MKYIITSNPTSCFICKAKHKTEHQTYRHFVPIDNQFTSVQYQCKTEVVSTLTRQTHATGVWLTTPSIYLARGVLGNVVL